MEGFISRREICQELEIDEASLKAYEDYLELPCPADDEYSISVAKAISKINDLCKAGMTFSEIKNLSFFAEQFETLIPSLHPYTDLSPKKNIKEALLYYQDLLQAYSEREARLKEKLIELEERLTSLDHLAEENDYLKSKLNRYNDNVDEYKTEYAQKLDYISELESKVSQLELQCNDLYYQVVAKDNTITKLQESSGIKDEYLPKSAVDIETLLKKKEREFEIKHQRKIFDLKKQVETLVAQKEQEWLNKLES